MYVKGLLLFLRKFLFNRVEILLDSRVVVIAISGRKSVGRAGEMTLEWNALGKHAFSSDVVYRREARWWVPFSCHCESLKRLIPVPMAIGIFAAHPAYKISVMEM
jgi:hypothetical protein